MRDATRGVDSGAERTGVALASGAVLLVGGSVAASSLLTSYPVLGGQGVRYAAAGLLLVAWARVRGQPLPRPVGREWSWLAGLAAVGLAGCSVGLVAATRVADPAAVGIVIGAAPLLIALAGPLGAGRRPAGRLLVAAVVVAASTASTQGGGGPSWSLSGLLLCLGALIGVAGSSLLAVPVLPRLGPLAVSAYACGLAAVQLLAVAALVQAAGGPPVLRVPTAIELAALSYLAVAVTAIVLLAWYAAVERLGVARTGLFNGLIPVASLTAVAVAGTGTITRSLMLGAIVVVAGLLIGLSAPAVGADRADLVTTARRRASAPPVTTANRRRREAVRPATEVRQRPPRQRRQAMADPDRRADQQL